MPYFVVKSGTEAGRRIELAGPSISIGRHSSNTIALADDRVSRQHLVLHATAHGYTLVDLGSGNGSLVNGNAITEHTLQPGDAITVGDTVLVYEDEQTRFRTSIVRTVPETAGRQILANLGVLYEAAAAVSHILDVDELLGRILDLVLNATQADHAGVLLIDPGTGELMPRVVRSRSESSFHFSRTIVDYVRTERQGVLVSDAAADTRFAGGESIARHHLREVIAVPMSGRHESIGVLVLDTHTSAGQAKFSADHLNLAVAIAHQAALAVEETRYHRALMDAERLAAVGQTMAGMSHHIKNILQGTRFGGDMIRSGLADDDRELIAKGWKLVEKNQGRIDALILDMLSFSKEREPSKELTNLKTLIEDVLELVRGRAEEKGVVIESALPDGLPPLNCDADAIHAAILNVIGNAIDALDGVNDPKATIAAFFETHHTLIVDDNGPGVALEHRDSIFEPFVSTKGSRGTGLGLPVSRKILREHGGELSVEASPLGGARFVFRFVDTRSEPAQIARQEPLS